MTEPQIFQAARGDAPVSGLTSKRLAIAIALLALLGVAGYFGYQYLFKPFTPLDTPLGQAFGRALPTFLIDVQRELAQEVPPSALEERARSVLDPKSREILGPKAVDHFEAMLKAQVQLEAAKTGPRELSDLFTREANAFDDEAAARGLPYFLESTLIRSRRDGVTLPVIYAYYVERESQLRGADRAVRALHVRRLDNLNIATAAMGYTKPSSTVALILLDHVEGHLIQYVLPAVVEEGDTVLVDLESLDPESPWQRELRDRSSAIVREAYASLPGVLPSAVQELGKLIYRRRELVRSWMKALDKRNIRLRTPSRLIPEANYAEELRGQVSGAELQEWNALHARLLEEDVLRAFDAIRDQHARSIEQHEAQHQLDYARAAGKMPPVIAAVMGVKSDEALEEGSFNEYVVGEVSAYLAEIARAPDSPSLLLMVLLQSAWNADEWGGAYCYAALAVLDAVGRELGLPDEKLTGSGRVLRDRVTSRFAAVAGKPAEEIRKAARRAWEGTFNAALADVTLEKTSQNRPWRH
jgi:hypothetical protein